MASSSSSSSSLRFLLCLNRTSHPDSTKKTSLKTHHIHICSSLRDDTPQTPSAGNSDSLIPTMSQIMESSRIQKLGLELQTLGPFFRVRGLSLEREGLELGRAEGVIRPWLGGKVLHLDSIRMSRETLGMDRSVFGLGLFVGAAAVRHGFDCGCRRAELLAINDSDLYHSKLVRFYTRMGFKAVGEVDGSSTWDDVAHMLVWGGKGTRMDASIEDLLLKWGARFMPPSFFI